MVKRIILTHPDGHISIRGNVTPGFLASHNGDLDAALQDLLTNYVPVQNPGVAAVIMDTVIPERDYLRDSWRSDGVNISHDMPKARAIHLTEIRRVRNAELEKEDINMLKAIEAGDASAQSTVATKKQVLRDIPATFSLDGYADPTALKAAWPSELPERE